MCTSMSGVSKAIKQANCLSSYLLLIASLLFMTKCSCGGSKERFSRRDHVMGTGQQTAKGHRSQTHAKQEKHLHIHHSRSSILHPVTPPSLHQLPVLLLTIFLQRKYLLLLFVHFSKTFFLVLAKVTSVQCPVTCPNQSCYYVYDDNKGASG